MKRRDVLTKVPVVAAGMTVGVVAWDAEAAREAPFGVGGHEGASGSRAAQGGSGGPSGFRLVGESSEVMEAQVLGVPRSFVLHTYVVECAYGVGSKAWLAIADRDEDGQLVALNGYGATVFDQESRRVMFPRFVLRDLGETVDVRERARGVLAAAAVHGFDNAEGPEHEWIVVHVEYRCPDGVEHTMVGMPLTWDPRLALGVMVRGQIG